MVFVKQILSYDLLSLVVEITGKLDEGRPLEVRGFGSVNHRPLLLLKLQAFGMGCRLMNYFFSIGMAFRTSELEKLVQAQRRSLV